MLLLHVLKLEFKCEREPELLVTCHYIETVIFRGGLKSYQVGETKSSHNTPTGSMKGLSRTSYGESAMELDSSNTLRNISEDRYRAEFKIIRVGDEDSTDVYDR